MALLEKWWNVVKRDILENMSSIIKQMLIKSAPTLTQPLKYYLPQKDKESSSKKNPKTKDLKVLNGYNNLVIHTMRWFQNLFDPALLDFVPSCLNILK